MTVIFGSFALILFFLLLFSYMMLEDKDTRVRTLRAQIQDLEMSLGNARRDLRLAEQERDERDSQLHDIREILLREEPPF